jgi:hypothetical protein
VLRGSVFTATHVRTCYLVNQCRDVSRGKEITDWFRVWEELRVDFIDSSEVVHVGKEDIDLDCLGKTGAASLENGTTSWSSVSTGLSIPGRVTLLLTGYARLVPGGSVRHHHRCLPSLNT